MDSNGRNHKIDRLLAPMKALPSTSKKIGMLAYTFYEWDNRVMRYAESLSARGDEVVVIAVNNGQRPAEEVINGVHVHRVQRRAFNEKGTLSYLLRLSLFSIRAMFALRRLARDRAFDVIHVHNIPDFLVFAAWREKLKGTRIILDIHDILPEFYASKFGVDRNSLLIKILRWVERRSVRLADYVIVANHLWYDRLVARSARKEACRVILNYPDPEIFYPRELEERPDTFTMIYPGTLAWHQGLDVAIRAMSRVIDQLPECQLHIYGDGHELHSLHALTQELNLQSSVLFKGCKGIREIPAVMSHADVGIVPKRKASFGDEAFSTKIFEFMSVGVPVIASDTTIDRYYFNDDVITFFESDNDEDLAKTILALARDPQRRTKQAADALAMMEDYSWSRKKSEYFEIIDNLCEPRASA